MWDVRPATPRSRFVARAGREADVLTSGSPQSHCSPSSTYPFPHLRPPEDGLTSGRLKRHTPTPFCRLASRSFRLQLLNSTGKGYLRRGPASQSPGRDAASADLGLRPAVPASDVCPRARPARRRCALAERKRPFGGFRIDGSGQSSFCVK